MGIMRFRISAMIRPLSLESTVLQYDQTPAHVLTLFLAAYVLVSARRSGSPEKVRTYRQ
jgi:hypothetical protein